MADFSIDRLNIEIAANATKASQALDKLITRVDKLTKSMQKLAPVSAKVNASLKGIGKTTKAIDVKPLNSLSSNIQTLTKQNTALNKLNTTLAKVATTSKKVSSATTSNTSGNGTSTGGGLLGMFSMVGKLGLIYYGLRRVGEGFAYAIGAANDLVETTNLFNVAMGESVESAQAFVDTFASTTGLNPVEIMEGTALFYQISTAMGLATDKASILSENFTKLAFDLASLYNIETDEAFTKLKAGLVGETEPLRRLGLVITENNLAETARRHGITKSIRTMTEAEKMQLRYVTLMEQSTNAQGDFARTIEQPANMLRVLKGGIEQLAIAFGNMFIPVLTKVLPYLIAFVDVLTDAINKIAIFFGYSPDVFGSLGNDVEDLGESAEDTASSIASMLAPFDELNILNASSSSSATGGDLLDLNLEAYDNLLSTLKPKWLSIAEDIKKSFDGAFGDIDTSEAVKALDNLKSTLGEIYENIIDPAWNWFVTNVISPFAKWTIEKAVPEAINSMSEALIALANISELLLPLLIVLERVFNFGSVDVSEGLGEMQRYGGIESSSSGLFGFKTMSEELENFNRLWDKYMGTYAWDERRALLESSLSMYMNKMKSNISFGFDQTKLVLAEFKDVTLPTFINNLGSLLEGIVNTVVGGIASFIDLIIIQINRALSAIGKTEIDLIDFEGFDIPDVDVGVSPIAIQEGLDELARYGTVDTFTDTSAVSSSVPTSSGGMQDMVDYYAQQYTNNDTSSSNDTPINVKVVVDSKEIAKASYTGFSILDRQNGK